MALQVESAELDIFSGDSGPEGVLKIDYRGTSKSDRIRYSQDGIGDRLTGLQYNQLSIDPSSDNDSPGEHRYLAVMQEITFRFRDELIGDKESWDSWIDLEEHFDLGRGNNRLTIDSLPSRRSSGKTVRNFIGIEAGEGNDTLVINVSLSKHNATIGIEAGDGDGDKLVARGKWRKTKKSSGDKLVFSQGGSTIIAWEGSIERFLFNAKSYTLDDIYSAKAGEVFG